MRARKYTQVDSLYSHTFGWFYDVRGMDDLFLYSSRGRHRNNHKLEKSTFFAKNVPFSVFVQNFCRQCHFRCFLQSNEKNRIKIGQ